MKRTYAALRNAVCVLCALFWAGLFFLIPASTEYKAENTTYLCRWEDGSETEETYYDAYLYLVGIEDGILLSRAGLRGTIALTAACEETIAVFESGDFEALVSHRADGLTRLERAALYRKYSGRLWYAGDYYEWTGEAFSLTSAREVEEVVLLDGSITAARLVELSARALYLGAGAELSNTTLIGTEVERVVPTAPYGAAGNAVTLDTPGGVRLIAGLPLASSVEVPEEVRYADEGALLACRSVQSITVPFVGNAKSNIGSAYRGEFAHLFSTGTAYEVPPTLRKVRVTGGYITSHAFYACPLLEEIDACGLGYDDIEYDAFADCVNLWRLHSPRSNLLLQGNFKKSIAPCGCTVFERVAGDANG